MTFPFFRKYLSNQQPIGASAGETVQSRRYIDIDG